VEATFRAFRVLNEEIKSQNLQVDSDSFQVRAVEKWLDLHKVNLDHQPPLARTLRPLNAGDVVWENKEGAPDKELLPLLNSYCYRCHSSVVFNVFEKQAVAERKVNILFRTQLDLSSPGNVKVIMPQDRVLTDDVKKRLGQLVEKLPDL
jgi:hypothetical protein